MKEGKVYPARILLLFSRHVSTFRVDVLLARERHSEEPTFTYREYTSGSCSESPFRHLLLSLTAETAKPQSTFCRLTRVLSTDYLTLHFLAMPYLTYRYSSLSLPVPRPFFYTTDFLTSSCGLLSHANQLLLHALAAALISTISDHHCLLKTASPTVVYPIQTYTLIPFDAL